MIMLTKEQLADLLRAAFGDGAIGPSRPEDLPWFNTEAYLDERERAIQRLVSRVSSAHGDAERFVWMIEKAQTGSMGFGEFVLFPGDALDDVRAVIDSAMNSTQEEGQ